MVARCFALLIWTLIGVSAVKSDGLNVQHLYESCRAPDRSAEWALCIAYISGVGNMMQYVGSVSRNHPDENYSLLAICGEITNAAMVQSIQELGAEKSARMDLSAIHWSD
jgi:hypothetical protein